MKGEPILILILGLLNCLSGISSIEKDLRDDILFPDFIQPRDLRIVDDEYVHVAMIVTNIMRSSKNESGILVEMQMEGENTKLLQYLKKFLSSLLFHSTGTKLHLIWMTDEDSEEHLRKVIKDEVGKFLSETVIKPSHITVKDFNRIFPERLLCEFVNIESIVKDRQSEINAMKNHFGHHIPPGTVFKPKDGIGPDVVGTQKYTLNLFYVVPFYHLVFPEDLEKLVVLDIDLEIKTDLSKLHNEFNNFQEGQGIGLANDQTPHYRSLLSEFRKFNPETQAGEVGFYQGFNTGVALYNLAVMRASDTYLKSVEPNRVVELATKYKLRGTVGDQDWLTVLSWESPNLFHRLPCQFNVQTDQVYNTEKWKDLWPKYHNCPNRTLILHRNGE